MAVQVGPIVKRGYSVRGQAYGAHVRRRYSFFFLLLGGTSAFSYAGSSLFFFSYVGVLRHLAMPARPSFFFPYTLTGCEGYAVHPH